ncbi:MAG: fumarylacetoacetase [Actinobacteria bacterium]|nr:fumarylacetoacetase [Actinomycetota bacterium]
MASPSDPTADPALRSWVPVREGSDFPIQNLPYGVFRRGSGDPGCIGVAIGDSILDLGPLAREGLLHDSIPNPTALEAASLEGILGLGRPAWRKLRGRISELLSTANREIRDVPELAERVLVPLDQADMALPVAVRNYVDFYSSFEHASNMGRMFRPDAEPLLPNWRHLPVGYHGRAGTVVVSGTPVVRPRGQTKGEDDPAPSWGPTRMLDIELEVGFLTGAGNRLGAPIPIRAAGDHIFGLVLVNDWSARDIQRWEYQPLGPFLGKSFATSISPWVVTLDALDPYRVAGPAQDPEPLPYLRADAAWAFDIELEVGLSSAAMSERGLPPHVISRTNFRSLYWSMAQQLAHATSNGATAGAGDLFASGTISGSDPSSYGSLLELTWRGTRPLVLPDGSKRAFLEDGDTVVMRGWCGEGHERPRIGFGEVNGTILASPEGPGNASDVGTGIGEGGRRR